MTLPTQVLSGTTVLVTRSSGQAVELTQLLEHQGARVVEMPTLEIGPPSDWTLLDQAIEQIETFDWLILTSANGVRFFFERLKDLGHHLCDLVDLKLAVVGTKTAESLLSYGRKPDFIPPEFVADALVAHFPEPLVDQTILFPRVESGGRDILAKELAAAGAKLVEVPAYESRCPDVADPMAITALQSGEIHVITFASSKTVKNFCQLIEGVIPSPDLGALCIASIGPQTSKTCRELLGRVDVEAEAYTLEGLVNAVVQWVIAHRS